MRPIVVTTNGASTSSIAVMDYMGRPEVSLQLDVTGTVSCTVQQTLDDPFDSTITAVWVNHPDSNLVAATTDKQGDYTFIPRAVRLVQASGAGSARLTIVQAGS